MARKSACPDACFWGCGLGCVQHACSPLHRNIAVIGAFPLCAGVAVRSGHHCTQPLHAYLGINASARASPYIYNTEEEIDIFLRELEESIAFFRDA